LNRDLMECPVMNSLEAPRMAMNHLFHLSLPSQSWVHGTFHSVLLSLLSWLSWISIRFGSETMCPPILLPCLSNSRYSVSRQPHSDGCANGKRAAGNFPSISTCFQSRETQDESDQTNVFI
jgi:hypothetical protein